MAGDTPAPSGIDPSVATAARMYDYYLGGHENFAADRIAALKVIEAAPEAPGLIMTQRHQPVRFEDFGAQTRLNRKHAGGR